ncbi:MAG: energy-coupling factor transporter transmembrane protein EcfT [Clostridiaceae bacterium]|nr:energy-coupling factor transporter transmembrane protein EcfT [Clostridiaceae bacterium]MBW4859948.1 energy-coupling factor transporter transmembrane protein EcfT [Clostridiaceae bacterium]MBW4869332.1 energy-coupling factor transporter transmembrane protein EcfT [Clostridiaceae bacterium]
MKSFSSFHPTILFLYYLSVIFISMFTMNPVLLGCSLIGSILFFSMMNSPKVVLKNIGYYLLVFILIAITNPIFSHNGETILFFLNDNPVTLEAIIYGVVIATMLVAVIFWSKSYSEIMTSDKFVYLFGRTIPKLSLVLSMALRFIPMLKLQIKKVNQVQKTLGLYTTDSITDRIFSGIRVLNSVLTWSLENAINRADSMRARGYGLKRRTNFSLFKFYKRDGILLIAIILILVTAILGFVFNIFDFYYYPAISSLEITGVGILEYIFVFILMIIPFIIEVKENIQWKLLRSKI